MAPPARHPVFRSTDIKFAPVPKTHVGIVTPDEETIPFFQFVLKKLSNYYLACLHIAGPAEDLSGTPVAALGEIYFRHFRSNYSSRMMANSGFTQESGKEILQG